MVVGGNLNNEIKFILRDREQRKLHVSLINDL